MEKVIDITAKRDGFRRGGMVHSETTKTYPLSDFTKAQLEQIQNEPMLVVAIRNATDPVTDDALAGQVKTLTEQLAEANANVDAMTGELIDARKAIESTAAELAGNKQALEEANGFLTTERQKTSELATELETERQKVTDLTTQLEAATKKGK